MQYCCQFRMVSYRQFVLTKFSLHQVLNEMTELLSSCRNYDNYRQAYSKCAGFKIPILGVHLKDLISVNEAMSDYVDDSKVNVQKLQALYNHINELIQLQKTPPHLDANKDLVHLLTVSTQLLLQTVSYGHCYVNINGLSTLTTAIQFGPQYTTDQIK